jgi:hypothetical protein
MGLGANWMYLFYINALWCSTAIIHCNKSEVRRLILDNNWLSKTYEIIDNVYDRKWEINVREKRKIQSRMDNLKTQAVLGTQDTRWKNKCTDKDILSLIWFLRAISYLRCEMWSQIHFEQNISIEDFITWRHYNVILENSDIMLIFR